MPTLSGLIASPTAGVIVSTPMQLDVLQLEDAAEQDRARPSRRQGPAGVGDGIVVREARMVPISSGA